MELWLRNEVSDFSLRLHAKVLRNEMSCWL